MPSVSQSPVQTVVLAPQLRQGIKLLAMGIPELRRELLREMSENPVIDDVETGSLSMEEPSDDGADAKDDEAAVDSLGVAYLEGVNRGVSNPEAVERRERFFSNQVSEEGLEEHLLKQIPVSDIAEEDYELVEMLVGELDADGYFRGSLKEIAEVTGADEKKLRCLLTRISYLDPPGCGATTLRECLLSQLDAVRDEVLRHRLREMLNRLEDIAYVRKADPEVLASLRSLNPRPGAAFRHQRFESDYVRPEVHAVETADGYRAVVDDRGLPTIRISQRYLAMLEDPAVDAETKAYVRERLESVRALIDAVERRHATIAAIAQAIFDAQPEFFRRGPQALRPLTMQQIADKVGVHHTTVSRTVRGKYTTTPNGTFELRRFFTSGVVTESGEDASMTAVLMRLKEMVDSEDFAHPLSDSQLSQRLKNLGYAVARRTVAKYRSQLKIPSASKRTVRQTIV